MEDSLLKALIEAETENITVVDHNNFLMANINTEAALENAKRIYGHLHVLRVGVSNGTTAVRVQR